MPFTLRQKLTGFVTTAMIPLISGCVETMEMSGGGYHPSGTLMANAGLDQRQFASVMGAWGQSSVTIKMIIMALVMALMVAVIIGTTLYHKVENQKDN